MAERAPASKPCVDAGWSGAVPPNGPRTIFRSPRSSGQDYCAADGQPSVGQPDVLSTTQVAVLRYGSVPSGRGRISRLTSVKRLLRRAGLAPVGSGRKMVLYWDTGEVRAALAAAKPYRG